ncbi:MAG: tRNA lysidine(34) synthetase TilS [Motiliproteus sp.]|nr:tRNA lysidine(34) synthetase TilS [Motiliproteus sp.]MCW9054076.1 tRNA lysidine(34) synthetase TilS [Motiliproteus sp.]
MSPSADFLLEQLSAHRSVNRWFVALSGGLDSTALLHLAIAAGLSKSRQLQAIHIHHGMQSEADDWEAHCQQLCQRLQVPLIVHHVEVASGASAEAMARQARYQAFEQILGPGDGLLMAHHLDDQAETLLLRMLRGSGPRGLAAIPQERALGEALLFRPLLSLTRQQLLDYACQHELDWCEDPSNQSEDYDRNFLRHQVMPVLTERWPRVATSFAQSATYCAESDRLNQQLAELDLQAHGDGESLQCQSLSQLSEERQRNLLRYWLGRQGASLPSISVLMRIIEELLPARDDAQPLVAWADVEVRRFQGAIYLTSARWQVPESIIPWQIDSTQKFEFGRLSTQSTKGEGLALKYLADVEIRFRRGGERIKPVGQKNTRALKKLLQESQIPPWRRSQLPLIYVAGELVAVAGLWIADGYQALPDEAGIKFCWESFFYVDHD